MDSPGAIFARFLKFGCLAWGGPAAQIAMIKRECVDEEKWIDQLSFQRTLAVYQVLPGPEAHELCVYFGRLRGGKLGGFMAGLGFMLPGFLLMLSLSALYVEADIAEHLDALFYGLSAAVGALVARALVRLGKSFIRDVPLALIAVAGFALTLYADASFVLVLLGGGLAYELWRNARDWLGRAASLSLAPATLIWIGAGAITVGLVGEIFLEGLKAGLLTFGGAYTVVPFLHDSAIDGHHWLSESQFVDGLAIGGILPAPLIIFATFVGYLAGGLVRVYRPQPLARKNDRPLRGPHLRCARRLAAVDRCLEILGSRPSASRASTSSRRESEAARPAAGRGSAAGREPWAPAGEALDRRTRRR